MTDHSPTPAEIESIQARIGLPPGSADVARSPGDHELAGAVAVTPVAGRSDRTYEAGWRDGLMSFAAMAEADAADPVFTGCNEWTASGLRFAGRLARSMAERPHEGPEEPVTLPNPFVPVVGVWEWLDELCVRHQDRQPARFRCHPAVLQALGRTVPDPEPAGMEVVYPIGYLPVDCLVTLALPDGHWQLLDANGEIIVGTLTAAAETLTR